MLSYEAGERSTREFFNFCGFVGRREMHGGFGGDPNPSISDRLTVQNFKVHQMIGLMVFVGNSSNRDPLAS